MDANASGAVPGDIEAKDLKNSRANDSNNIVVGYWVRLGWVRHYELVHTPENSQLLQSDITSRKTLTSWEVSRTKNWRSSMRPAHHGYRITTLRFYYGYVSAKCVPANGL